MPPPVLGLIPLLHVNQKLCWRAFPCRAGGRSFVGSIAPVFPLSAALHQRRQSASMEAIILGDDYGHRRHSSFRWLEPSRFRNTLYSFILICASQNRYTSGSLLPPNNFYQIKYTIPIKITQFSRTLPFLWCERRPILRPRIVSHCVIVLNTICWQASPAHISN